MDAETPMASSVELVLQLHAPLIDLTRVNRLAVDAAASAMAPASKAAIVADLRCYLGWCARRRPPVTAIPAEPETLVHYLRWLEQGSDLRQGAKPATLARRIASIARMHRILGFGEKEPLATQAGMVRDTLKGARRKNRRRQRQAAPLRLGDLMAEGQGVVEGVTLRALLATCGRDIVGLRDAALFSVAYDAGLRVSELAGATIDALRQVSDGSGRLEIVHSKTDQEGQGATAWLSPETMERVSAWLGASGLVEGPVFRRINALTSAAPDDGRPRVRYFIGDRGLTRQGIVAILRRRVVECIDGGEVEIEPSMVGDVVRALSAHSFRVGLTQDLFAAGEDGAGIALALRWSSPATALRYARELTVGNNAAARVLGKVRGAA